MSDNATCEVCFCMAVTLMTNLRSILCKVNAYSSKLCMLLEPHSSIRFQYRLLTMTTFFQIAVLKSRSATAVNTNCKLGLPVPWRDVCLQLVVSTYVNGTQSIITLSWLFVLSQENMRGQRGILRATEGYWELLRDTESVGQDMPMPLKLFLVSGSLFSETSTRITTSIWRVFSEKEKFQWRICRRDTNIFREETKGLCFSRVYKRSLLAGYAKN